MLVIPVTRVRDMKNSASLRQSGGGNIASSGLSRDTVRTCLKKKKRGAGRKHGSACP